MLQRIKNFHELTRKRLKYPFRAFLVIEPHYQEETETYNMHVHYGVFSLFNIRTFRNLWCKAWDNPDLIVKFPSFKGKPVYKTRKYAFLEYMCKRRAQQARAMPLRDYYDYVQKRQLLKRIGFTKGYLAKVTTLRTTEDRMSKLPDGFSEKFLGACDSTYDFSRLEVYFRRRYNDLWLEERDVSTVTSMGMRVFKDIVELLKTDNTAKVEQTDLKKIPVIIQV